MFLGTHNHTIDEKGRVSIPKEFRSALDSPFDEKKTLVITRYYDYRLRAYTPDEYKKMVNKIKNARFSHQDNRDFQLFFAGGTHVCKLDGHGRILLPEELRKYAGLERDVVVVGQLDAIDIYDKGRHDQVLERAIRKANESIEFPPPPHQDRVVEKPEVEGDGDL